jgi:hypothetical protein
LAICILRQAYGSRLRHAFQSCGDIHAVTHQIAIGYFDHVTEVDADTEFDAPLRRKAGVSLSRRREPTKQSQRIQYLARKIASLRSQ